MRLLTASSAGRCAYRVGLHSSCRASSARGGLMAMPLAAAAHLLTHQCRGVATLTSSGSGSSGQRKRAHLRGGGAPSPVITASDQEMIEDILNHIPFSPAAVRLDALYMHLTVPALQQSNSNQHSTNSGSGLGNTTTTTNNISYGRRTKKEAPVTCDVSLGARRRQFIRRFNTLKAFLMHIAQEERTAYGVFLSVDQVLATRSTCESLAGEAFAKMYQLEKESGRSTSPTAESEDTLIPRTIEDYCYPIEAEEPTTTDTLPTHTCHSEAFSQLVKRRTTLMSMLSLAPLTQSEPLLSVYMPVFDDLELPEPPSETSASGAVAAPTAATGENTFHAQMWATIVPPFFIPLQTLLEDLPEGYTVDHLLHVFSRTDAVEVVHLLGHPFVRLHGGKDSEIDFGFIKEEESRQTRQANNCHDGYVPWRKHTLVFAPDPFLCDAFLPLFRRPFTWLSMRHIITQSPPQVQAALGPWQEYHALLFFAQMQHLFQFVPDGDGQVCWASPVTTLRETTSPVPVVVAELVRWLEKKQRVYVSEIEAAFDSSDSLRDGETAAASGYNYHEHRQRNRGGSSSAHFSDYAKRQVLLYFGTLRQCLAAHGSVFVLSDATTTKTEDKNEDDSAKQPPPPPAAAAADCPPEVMGGGGRAFGSALSTSSSSWIWSEHLTVQLKRDLELHQKHRVSLEDKLEKALIMNDRRAARKVRRRLALKAQPDSPYADTQLLLDAILRFLPPRRHVSMRSFLKALPSSLHDFLPENVLHLVRTAGPSKVQVFEYRFRNHVCLMRPGLPLPDGHLRRTFSDAEVVYMVAAELHHCRSGNSRSIESLYGLLSLGAREHVSMSTKTLCRLIQAHPRSFLLVFRGNDVRSAEVTLLEMPPMPSTLSPEEFSLEGRTPHPEEIREMESLDQAALESWNPDA